MIQRLKNRIARALAHWRVATGKAERICAPGQWVVWREGEIVLSKDLGA